MRRTTTSLATLATAAAMALTPVTAALAAHGELVVSGKRYHNPAPGCYAGNFRPLSVDNRTDTTVEVFTGEHCQGAAVERVRPGGSGFFEFGTSVRVPR